MLWASFLLGFAGSFHCIGMCGPIALAFTGANVSNIRYMAGRFVYNIGRTFTYTFMGAGIGTIKYFADMRFDIHRLQEWLSIAVGVGILLFVFIPGVYKTKIMAIPSLARFLGRLRGQIAPRMRSSRYGAQFTLGALNGFLPCGFVYIGLAGALMADGPSYAAASMAMFGLGTIPAMLGAALFARFTGGRLRLGIRRLLPFGAAVIAMLFILRGLALGIPYISPKITVPQETHECCHEP